MLASGSLARQEILAQVGADFIVDVSDFEEDMTLNLPPAKLAVRLATGKARAVSPRHAQAVILAADSFAVYKEQLLGKPYTVERARKMLKMLSGQMHSFITGFAILDSSSGQTYTEVVETKVYFRKITISEIDCYLSEENVLDKAGAYIIQGRGALFIDRIEGNYTNVMGLPIAQVAVALKRFGVDLFRPIKKDR